MHYTFFISVKYIICICLHVTHINPFFGEPVVKIYTRTLDFQAYSSGVEHLTAEY